MHPFKQKFLDAITKIQNNQFFGSGHLPIEVYEIFLHHLTNQTASLSEIFQTKEAADKLKKTVINLAENDRFAALFKSYELACQHREKIKQELKDLTNKNPPQVGQKRNEIIANYYFQQKVWVGLVVNLPTEVLTHKGFLAELSQVVFSLNFKEISQLESVLNDKIKQTGQKTNLTLSEELVQKAANQTANLLQPKTPTPLNKSLFLLSFVFGTNRFLKTTQEQPIADEEETQPEPAEDLTTYLTTTLGTLAGIGYVFSQKSPDEFAAEEKKEKEKPKADAQKTKSEEPNTEIAKTNFLTNLIQLAQQKILNSTPSSLSNLKSLSSLVVKNFGRILKKVVDIGLIFLTGGTSKAVQIALKVVGVLFSFLGKTLTGLGGVDQSDNLKKITIGVLLVLITPLFLIFSSSFFDIGVLKPTALVSSLPEDHTQTTIITDIRSNLPTTTPFLENTPTPTVLLPSLSPPSTPPSEEEPSGFPIDSSCVTQLPGGSFSHENLNAVDIGAIIQNNAWLVRSTHAGRVILADNFGKYGLTVLVESLSQNYITYYGHLRPGSLRVKTNEVIAQGTILGVVDNTGYSTGDHLHYEIRGPRNNNYPWGTKEGRFGTIGTILNFLPPCFTWSCQWYCNLNI